MAVQGVLSVTLEVPDVAAGVRFYADAGLVGQVDGQIARLRCAGQDRDSLVLLGGFERKRLHHVSLRATGLDAIAGRAGAGGGIVRPAPAGRC